jgi:glutamate-1-semialdehyde aminotransferase
VIVVPFNNLDLVEGAFKSGQVSCFLHHCNALYEEEYLRGVRELTRRYGVVLLFDEVVSGFRYSAGGAQGYYGVTPDLTALGKIIGGGAPVGAICGREDIMEIYAFKDDYWNRFVRISVGGTWNAQPICVAGGVEMMKKINEEKDVIYSRLYDTGKRLTRSFNEIAGDLGVAAYAYGLPVDNPTTVSLNLFREKVNPEHVYLWETGPRSFEDYHVKARYYAPGNAGYATYLSMINNGVFSYSGRGGTLCVKYTEEDLEKTEEAFENTLRILKENKLVGLSQ